MSTTITAQMVKELRDKTGVGMMDCKKALVEADGNMDAAFDFLRKAGILKVSKGDYQTGEFDNRADLKEKEAEEEKKKEGEE